MALLDKELLPSDLTFGIELECIGNKATEFIESNPTDFLVERDSSLDDENGIEFISPIMRYSGEYLYNIKDTLDFIKSNGFYIDERCGGHIHVGASYLGDVRAILNLLVIYKYFEKEIYAISNPSQSKIRMGSSNHASSIGDVLQIVEAKFKKNKDASYGTFIDSMKLKPDSFSSKKYGLNISNIGTKEKDTVEFRVSNGTLDFDVIRENMVLFGSLVKTSRDIFDFYEYQLQINSLLSEKRADTRRMDMLMNLIFEDERLKDIYFNRYESNMKDPMLNNLGIEETTLSNYPSIKKVLSAKR